MIVMDIRPSIRQPSIQLKLIIEREFTVEEKDKKIKE